MDGGGGSASEIVLPKADLGWTSWVSVRTNPFTILIGATFGLWLPISRWISFQFSSAVGKLTYLTMQNSHFYRKTMSDQIELKNPHHTSLPKSILHIPRVWKSHVPVIISKEIKNRETYKILHPHRFISTATKCALKLSVILCLHVL